MREPDLILFVLASARRGLLNRRSLNEPEQIALSGPLASATLVPAMRAVIAGRRWIPIEIASRLASRKLFEELTSGPELQVLQLAWAKGLAKKLIGDVLSITEHTVKDHLESILGKLHVADPTEAVTAPIQRGIIHV